MSEWWKKSLTVRMRHWLLDSDLSACFALPLAALKDKVFLSVATQVENGVSGGKSGAGENGWKPSLLHYP